MYRYAILLSVVLSACGKGEGDTADTAPPTRCELLDRTERSYEAGGTGGLNGVAGDFTLSTRGGSYTYSTDWSGCDTLVFILSNPRQNGSFANADIWAEDHWPLLANSPDNVHYFFVPSEDQDVEGRLAVIEQGMASVLAGLPEAERTAWEDRLHYVTTTPSGVGGWLGGMLLNPAWGIVIDPAQNVRYMGSFADKDRYDSGVGWFAPNLSKAANEARYANFVVQRQERLDDEDVTIVELWQDEQVQGSPRIEVSLPDAATMASFDTLEYDLTTNCVGEGEFGDCPAWDYLVYMYQCDDAVDAVDAHATTACQPHVPEVVGTCVRDGSDTTDTCRNDTDCDDGVATTFACSGYLESIAADTLTGACEDPLGGASDGTYTCNDQGTGYNDLVCPCGTETGRWITTYHREGRWVHDATPFLALLQAGGTKTFRFSTSQQYDLTLNFRLSNRGIGYRPTSLTRLYRGGYYNPTINESYQPMDVAVPSGAAHVELATITSGHGGGQLNCGEFCHTTNHVFVDSTEFVIEDDWVDVNDGCEQQVDMGTVPNQYGTWWYGRNGWCPGKEVPVVRNDLDGIANPGSTVTFDHETYGPNGIDLNGGNGERIEFDSWLVVYE
ncbi:MAG: hypothetical protein KC912_02495 [Proteobacteria bacterium]|nr:hypothetical protein [Pseudomonadota bacterium]